MMHTKVSVFPFLFLSVCPEGLHGFNLDDRVGRRGVLATTAASCIANVAPPTVHADDAMVDTSPVEVSPLNPDAKKLFNEGRALESQGNMFAAQRLYAKVTRVSPRFIYGYSNLGNTQVALGDLAGAEDNYSTAIDLCRESRASVSESSFGIKKCSDLYVLHLNRGSVRLNNGRPKDALKDLQNASVLREQPDAVVLQNLARAEELNGMYSLADKDYTVAISMTANEVNPFWLRSAMVKFQLQDPKGAMDLVKRVDNRFPEAPEVRAAYAALLAARGDDIESRQKFLEIPDRQRKNYSDDEYLRNTVSWTPAMIESVKRVAAAVGDR